ncbi:conserved hypothetical protein [Deferribacter desulfuricans SSM1]|uniref:Uncharacterized protein n=1 Tax=Deferribacter desulfuricans (strain DSM 14783 / JCM 11476 / NBRC 101012 / SSM1) TaxID=639282 RepID=D3PAH6_DEFDS|nr:hypothetical protein [Deferribacter desulfuricans]BAI79599.1 conserved hypothetical protein [Deferribacter desulfuricans SSM1]
MNNSNSTQKDLSFLENEYLTYLLIEYFLGNNTLSINDINLVYDITHSIYLENSNYQEKITIISENLNENKELITALKNSKKVSQLNIKLTSQSIDIEATLKTKPLRITGIKAPISKTEEISDTVLERILYLKLVYAFFDKTLVNFAKIRTSDKWYEKVKKFRKKINL